MCGIAGILNLFDHKKIPNDICLKMIAILNHRGPEQSGVYRDPDINLGHSRLGIIGLERGIQPISNRDGTLWIVYNGEVFNYIELKEFLEKKGHEFKTETDTEVVLHLYEETGPKALSMLNGQFAFAIWNPKEKELFLARDRVGICPLYYTTEGSKFLFASEIKALFMDCDVSRKIDHISLNQVFTCWTTLGRRTIFKGINELCPGHYMIIKGGKGHDNQIPYWTLPYYSDSGMWTGTQEEAAWELKRLVQDAVQLRLRADVPVGAYLSGGLDSSIITSIIARKFNNRLKTFSLGFEEKTFDESVYQKHMTEFLATDHCQTLITNSDVKNSFADVIWHCEKPILRTSPVPLYMLSRLVRKNEFKVVLTGEGADEVFGGYNIYKEAKIRAFWARHPDSKYRPLLLEKLYPYIFKNSSRGKAFLQKFFSVTRDDLLDPLMSHRKRWNNSRRCKIFFNKDILKEIKDSDPLEEILKEMPEGFDKRDLFSRTQWLEMSIFMSNYLLSSQGDRVAMANSVELRLPFLDHRIIDFAAKLPPFWKINGLNEKYILKMAFKDDLPEIIWNRPKQPYRAPISQAFSHRINNGAIDKFVTKQSLKDTGIFNQKKVANLFKKCIANKKTLASESENMAIVGIFSTQLIHEKFIENFNNIHVGIKEPDKVIQKD